MVIITTASWGDVKEAARPRTRREIAAQILAQLAYQEAVSDAHVLGVPIERALEIKTYL